MKKLEASFFWFRRDLRLHDNHGLFELLKENINVIPLFIFDKDILSKLKDKNDARVNFLYNTLEELKKELNAIGTDLLIIHDTPLDAWKFVIENYNVQEVACNKDYESYAIRRDEKVKKLLKTNSIKFSQYKDQCIFEEFEVVKKDGTPYTVYTPYKNKWRSLLTPEHLKKHNVKKYVNNFLKTKAIFSFPKLSELGFENSNIVIPQSKINKSMLKHYAEKRDIPSRDATSKLGIHLRFGTISIRECARNSIDLSPTWLDELIWRDFFMQILFHFPHVEKSSFRANYDNIKWENKKEHFKKWCEGSTGYPLVDAGMRELNATGHMHNRVRMVAASFLVKHLLIDWRWGEKYFAQKLLDYDLSSNNGNWQWVAGTGCDAAPYFRVFNPELQAKKFDPDGLYIKKWVPEWQTEKYVEPMINHRAAVARTLAAYKATR